MEEGERGRERGGGGREIEERDHKFNSKRSQILMRGREKGR